MLQTLNFMIYFVSSVEKNFFIDEYGFKNSLIYISDSVSTDKHSTKHDVKNIDNGVTTSSTRHGNVPVLLEIVTIAWW